MKKTGIVVKGYIGTWYVIDEVIYHGRKLYLLEHEAYGDETPCLIVDEHLGIILEDVCNGFSDLGDM